MARTFRQMLEDGTTTIVPGVGDALGALLVREAGFEAVNMSGYYVSAVLGYADVGLVTGSEMVDQARRLCAAVDLPVVADADTGYGNAINVIRTIRDFEQAGVAGVHLEDQSLPKKCGALGDLAVIGADEMCGKIRAAVDARRSTGFCIIARSDALASEGFDGTVRRARRYRDAGADAFMVMGARSLDDLKRFRDAIDGPLVCTVGSWGFRADRSDLQAIGYAMAFYTVSTLRRQIAATRKVLSDLRRDGGLDHEPEKYVTMGEMHEALGIPTILAWEEKYGGD